MRIGDSVFVHGYVDEIRKDCVIIRNKGGYFGTAPSEVIETINELPSAEAVHKPDYSYEADMVRRLKEALSADAVQGEWIPFDRTFGRSIWVCSACDNGTYVPCDAFTQKPIYDYCPNCGAKMTPYKGGEDE